ncbi:MAG: NHLP family bacteriocin export ABC transporter peptidase/permease/ATPase subunit [Planctomycetes bacterium]|nr:NHLP family bacteriocin export ABC transporter peptidase/permease/ATPase subunit [Planctomycetota bacterium]
MGPRIPTTPTVLQMEAVECGAASLGIVLAHWGRIVPLSELREECGISRDGSNAANVVKAARHYGLKAKGLSTEFEDVQKLPGPFIVFWNFNHFLVVEGFRKGRAYLNDPASGRRTVSLEEFDQAFTGVVLCMEPGPDFEKKGRPPSTIRALSRRLRGSERDLAFCIVAGLLLVAPGLAVPMMTQVFVDGVLIAGRRDWLRPLLLGLALMAVLQIVLRLLQLRYLRELRTKLAVKLSGLFLWHVLRLPVGFFAQRFAGEISSRLALNHGIAESLSGQLATVVIDCTMLLFYAAIMFSYDPILTSIGIAFAFGNLFALRWISRSRIDANMRLRQELGKVASVSISGLQSIETLKASALESPFFARWAGYYAKATEAQQDLDVSNQTLGVLPVLLSALTAMLILVVGGWRVLDGKLTIGMLVAFQGLMLSFQGPVGTLVDLGGVLQTLQGDLQRVDDVLLHPVDPQTDARGGARAAAGSNERLVGHVELRNVTFGYSRVAPPLVEGLNLVIRPGQRVALVGSSGSGKSTVAKLVCGLYRPWEGPILFDGTPRDELSRTLLASSLAMVDQDLLFFAGTVRDNLTLWDDTVPQAHLEAACRDAEIHDVILSLPGGYDAELLEGAANLSGGQRQRLEIARALINNPTILVLDEATSALDAETEFKIDQNLRLRGCSVLIVAHRLSTIRDSEEIIVLSRCRVAERGRHEELWTAGGDYRRLIQSEGGAL